MLLKILICLLTGYFCGCISTGYIVGKLNHVDIRNYGSGNLGTTNAMRTLGKKAGIFTYIGDSFKALIPIIIVKCIFSDTAEVSLLALCTGLGVMLGHNYPFWLKFKGGKGIAVTTGVMAALDPLSIPFMIVIFGGVLIATKYVSAASLVLSVFIPVWIAIRFPGDIYMLAVACVFTVSAFVRHRANIGRIMNRTENRIGQKVDINKDATEAGSSNEGSDK